MQKICIHQSSVEHNSFFIELVGFAICSPALQGRLKEPAQQNTKNTTKKNSVILASQSVLISGSDKPHNLKHFQLRSRGFAKKGEDLQKRERIYTKREDFRQQKGRRFATTKKGEDMPVKKMLSQLTLCGLMIKLNMNKSLSGEIKSYL